MQSSMRAIAALAAGVSAQMPTPAAKPAAPAPTCPASGYSQPYYALFGQNAVKTDAPLSQKTVADAAASFQAAVVEVLVAKCRQACRKFGMTGLCFGGGVAANGSLPLCLASINA